MRTIKAGSALLVISLLIGGCAEPARPRKILERSAAEIARSRTFIYAARAENRGSLQGRRPTVTGDVAIVRLDQDDPLGARVHAAGQVIAPTTGASAHFEHAYDGRTFRALRPGEDAIVESTPGQGGRALFENGADDLILLPLIDPAPFRAEIASRGLVRLPDTIVGGEPCAVVEVGVPPGSSLQRARWHISLHDWLPRRVEMLSPLGDGRSKRITTAEEMRVREPIALDTFTIAGLPESDQRPAEPARAARSSGTPTGASAAR